MDVWHRRVTRGNKAIPLSPREFEVLQVLMQEPGRVFSRTELCEQIKMLRQAAEAARCLRDSGIGFRFRDRGFEHAETLALDSEGGVHVSYRTVLNHTLRYARRATDGSWSSLTVDAEGDVGAYSSIAVDTQGAVHVSYYDNTRHSLKYALRSPLGAWATTEVDGAYLVGEHTSLALDAIGGVHVGYYSAGTGDLLYAHRSACQ